MSDNSQLNPVSPGEQPSDHLDLAPDDQPAAHLAQDNGTEPNRPLHPVETELNICFRDPSLLECAFIHRSYLNELLDDHAELVDNERLEFLGDTVLSYLVSERLYVLFPEQQEGGLTNLRSALVRRETLARLAMELHLGTYLKLGHGEEESGGRTRPATLCAVFEALIGAIYLDQGTDATKAVIFRLLSHDIDRLLATTHTKDPKSRLQEYIQAHEGMTHVIAWRMRLAPITPSILSCWCRSTGGRAGLVRGAANRRRRNRPRPWRCTWLGWKPANTRPTTSWKASMAFPDRWRPRIRIRRSSLSA